MAVFVSLLFRHLLGRRSRLWVLPLLVPLWVNLHGGFLAGLGTIGLALLLRLVQGVCRHGSRPRAVIADAIPLTLTLVACLVGSLLNPLGSRLGPYLRTELGFTENRVYIQEWQPVWEVWELWPALVPFFAVLATLLLVGARVASRRARVADLPAWVWVVSCVPLTVMAFQSNRHIPVQLIWTAPVIGILAGVEKGVGSLSFGEKDSRPLFSWRGWSDCWRRSRCFSTRGRALRWDRPRLARRGRTGRSRS